MKLSNLIRMSCVAVLIAVAMVPTLQAASKSSVPPSARQPLPDLKVISVTGSCNQHGVVKVDVTIRNMTGTPTNKDIKTKVGARYVTMKTKGGTTTKGMVFGEHTTPAGFAASESFSVEKHMGSGLLSVQILSATVDYTKKVHETYETNNSKTGNNFNCP